MRRQLHGSGLLLLPAVDAAVSPPTSDSAGYPACVRPSWVEPLDVTSDGVLDLVVTGEGDDPVVVLRGDVQGRFAQRTTVAVGGEYCSGSDQR